MMTVLCTMTGVVGIFGKCPNAAAELARSHPTSVHGECVGCVAPNMLQLYISLQLLWCCSESTVAVLRLLTVAALLCKYARFSSGPDGDPQPYDNIDYDRDTLCGASTRDSDTA
eukprot:4042749-Amphidinium_carterae.1